MGCEGKAGMGFEPGLGGIKGVRVFPLVEVGEMEIRATMEASGGQDKEDGGGGGSLAFSEEIGGILSLSQ